MAKMIFGLQRLHVIDNENKVKISSYCDLYRYVPVFMCALLSASSILLAHIMYIYFNCIELGYTYSSFIKGGNLLTSYGTDFLSHRLCSMTLVPDTSTFLFFVIEL